VLAVAGIGVSLLVRYQHWRDPMLSMQDIVARQLAAAHRSLPPSTSLAELARITLALQLLAALTVGLAINMIFTLGEEFGWRVYLLPRLAPLGGAWVAILSGMVWGLWHAPLIVVSGYNFHGRPWLGIALVAIGGLRAASPATEASSEH
jgi:CAAX protease family protein